MPDDAFDRGDKGYAFLNDLFAAEWQRNDHIWASRDWFYIIGIVAGLAICVLAIYEMYFIRKQKMNPLGLLTFLGGVVVSIVGVSLLHRTDSVSANTTATLVIGAGMLIGFFGWALWRYEPRGGTGGFSLPSTTIKPLGIGAAFLALSVICATSIDAQSSETIGWLYIVTHQGARAITFIGFAIAAAIYFLIATHHARRSSQGAGTMLLVLTAAIVAGMAFFIRSQSLTPKFRTQAFSMILAVAGVMAVWAVVSLSLKIGVPPNIKADRLGIVLGLVGTAGVILGLVCRLLFVTQAELDGGIPLTKFSVRILWFLLFTAVISWVLARTKVRQLDVRRWWQQTSSTPGRCTCCSDQDAALHAGVLRRVACWSAVGVPPQQPAGEHR